jgi:hypothetical protein
MEKFTTKVYEETTELKWRVLSRIIGGMESEFRENYCPDEMGTASSKAR